MVFRIEGSAPRVAALDFQPGGIAAEGQRAAAGFEAGVNALDAVMQKEAELFYETGMTEMRIGLESDLQEIAGQSLGGVGYEEAAKAAYNARKDAAFKLAGANPYKRALLERHFRRSDPEVLAGFKRGADNLATEHAFTLHKQHLDNAMQSIGRTSITQEFTSKGGIGSALPKGGAGVSNSAKMALFRLEQMAGTSFKVNSAFRDPEHNASVGGAKRSQHQHGNAFDIDVRHLSQEQRIDLIKKARAAGFQGIGVYKNTLHFDTGPSRAWGHDYKRGSLPDWAKEAVKAPVGVTNDDNGIPEYTGPIPDIWKNSEVSAHRDDLHAQVNAMGGITANKRAELKANIDQQLAQVAIGRLADESPSVALATLRSGHYDDVLSFEQDTRMQKGIRRNLEAEITRKAKAQAKVDRADAASQAGDWIAWNESGRRGEAPPALTLEQYGMLTPTQRASYDEAEMIGNAIVAAENISLPMAGELMRKLAPNGVNYKAKARASEAAQKVLIERAEREAVEQEVNSSVANGVAPDMTNSKVVDEVGARFQDAVGGSDAPFASAVGFIDVHKVAPKQFGVMIGKAMSSGDPALQAQAVEAVAMIDPRTLANLPKSAPIKRALAIGDWLNQGLSMDEAMKHTEAMLNEALAPNRERNLAAWNENRKENEEAAIEGLRDRIRERGRGNGLGRAEAMAAIPSGVAASYMDYMREAYSIHGNMDVAIGQAEQAFYRNHAITYVGSEPVWQFGAAEGAYPFFEDAERQSAWIGQQARLFASERLDGEVESISIIPSAESDPFRQDKPAYGVIANMSDGSTQFVPEFRPDRNLQAAIYRDAERERFAVNAPERQAAKKGADTERRRVESLLINEQADYARLFRHWETFDEPMPVEQMEVWRAQQDELLEKARGATREVHGAKDDMREFIQNLNELAPEYADIQAVMDEAMSDVGIGGVASGDADLRDFLIPNRGQ